MNNFSMVKHLLIKFDDYLNFGDLREIVLGCSTYWIVTGFCSIFLGSQATIYNQNGRLRSRRNKRCIFHSFGN